MYVCPMTQTTHRRRRRSDWRGPQDQLVVRVPADVGAELRAEAARRGVSLSDHVANLAAWANRWHEPDAPADQQRAS